VGEGRDGAVAVAAVIAARRADGIPVAVACRALGVSRAWFCKHKDGRLPLRAQRREALKAEVARLFAAHEGRYGSPRIAADLREADWRVSENTVAALMAELHLAARRKKKRKSTTRLGKGRWRAPDLVKRDFPATQLNTKWYGDGTEIGTGEGKLYLASVLDMAAPPAPRPPPRATRLPGQLPAGPPPRPAEAPPTAPPPAPAAPPRPHRQTPGRATAPAPPGNDYPRQQPPGHGRES